MKVRKPTLLAIFVFSAIATLMVACAPSAAPAVAPTAAPTAAVVASNAAPTAAPASQPTVAKPAEATKPAAAAAPAALDMKAVLDKYYSGLPDGFTAIQPAALKDQIAAAKPYLVDVRETKEVADNGFIEGSVYITIRTFAKNLDKLPAKDQPIVVACGSGHRSALGMMALQMLGYSNVKSLAGGFGAWKAANLPVATGKPADPVAGKAPDVDKELLAALDKYLSNLPDGFSAISATALKDQLDAAKPFQIDVREAKEVADNGYIAGSGNIPIRGLMKNLDKLPQDKATPIIAECGSGHRSAMAMMGLNLLGYTNVKSLGGGFGAWKAANLPIAK